MTADLNALRLTLNGLKPRTLNMKVLLSPKRCEASPHAVARLWTYPYLEAMVQFCSPSFLVKLGFLSCENHRAAECL